LGEPFGLLTEADQDTASTQCRFRKPLRQSMLAREVYRDLGSSSRCVKLAWKIVQNRGESQGEGEAVGVRDALAER
jgi:hypothetical protein